MRRRWQGRHIFKTYLRFLPFSAFTPSPLLPLWVRSHLNNSAAELCFFCNILGAIATCLPFESLVSKFNCWTIMREQVVFIIECTDWTCLGWDGQVPWATTRGGNISSAQYFILNPPFSGCLFLFGGANGECRHKIGFRLLDILRPAHRHFHKLAPHKIFSQSRIFWTYDTNFMIRTEQKWRLYTWTSSINRVKHFHCYIRF